MDIDFSFQFNNERQKFAIQINNFLSDDKSFMMRHKVGGTVFVPSKLISYYTGSDQQLSPLNAPNFQQYDSIKKMQASIGMLIYSCKEVVSVKTLLKNNSQKLIK